MKKYGSENPPHYNLKNISGFKILLICGTSDLLVSPPDYTQLYNELLLNGNRIDMKEYPHGHIGLLIPRDPNTTTKDIIEKI